MRMTAEDKKLLQALQTGLTVGVRPYAALARRFGLSEKALCARLQEYKSRGWVRYAGAILDMSKLGLVSGLVALRVTQRRKAQAVKVINALPNVSHNYERAGAYNLWFTLNAPSERSFCRFLADIKAQSGAEDVLDLRTQCVYKRQAVFQL